jgi:hypothetical protein
MLDDLGTCLYHVYPHVCTLRLGSPPLHVLIANVSSGVRVCVCTILM